MVTRKIDHLSHSFIQFEIRIFRFALTNSVKEIVTLTCSCQHVLDYSICKHANQTKISQIMCLIIKKIKVACHSFTASLFHILYPFVDMVFWWFFRSNRNRHVQHSTCRRETEKREIFNICHLSLVYDRNYFCHLELLLFFWKIGSFWIGNFTYCKSYVLFSIHEKCNLHFKHFPGDPKNSLNVVFTTVICITFLLLIHQKR